VLGDHGGLVTVQADGGLVGNKEMETEKEKENKKKNKKNNEKENKKEKEKEKEIEKRRKRKWNRRRRRRSKMIYLVEGLLRVAQLPLQFRHAALEDTPEEARDESPTHGWGGRSA
jgi:uncharacterized membrane protein YdbT with pleckstrin-like domain